MRDLTHHERSSHNDDWLMKFTFHSNAGDCRLRDGLAGKGRRPTLSNLQLRECCWHLVCSKIDNFRNNAKGSVFVNGVCHILHPTSCPTSCSPHLHATHIRRLCRLFKLSRRSGGGPSTRAGRDAPAVVPCEFA